MSLLSNIWKTIFSSQNTKLPTLEKKEVVNSILKNQNLKKVRVTRENTKFNQVRKHLIEKGSIDSWTAINLYGATRLSDIIFRLRNKGYSIDSIDNSAYDRNQELCNFTTYKYLNNNGVN
jgi:phosphorylcholine metabolism protein LicD